MDVARVQRPMPMFLFAVLEFGLGLGFGGLSFFHTELLMVEGVDLSLLLMVVVLSSGRSVVRIRRLYPSCLD